MITIVASVACTDSGGSNGTEQSPTSAIAFSSRGGDVFAWTQEVAGTTECGDVTLEVNGEALDVPIEVTGSSFSASVPVATGSNEIVARCGGGDTESQSSTPVVLEGRLRQRPTARIAVSVKGNIVEFDGGRSEATQPDRSVVSRYLWTPDPRHPSRLTTADGEPLTKASGPRLRLQAPSEDGEYYVALEVFDEQGRSDTSVVYFVVENGRPRAVDMMNEHPAWIDKAVIYAPIAVLWGNGGPKAVKRRLPYLKELGVDALWLWPPATLRSFGEEYAIDDYFKLDPSWGPKSAFKDMVDEAHRLGFHVLVDFVPNHMSDQSAYYQDAKKHGEASHYWDFFDRDAEGQHTYYFDWTNLPNLNYENPQVRRVVIESMSYWVRDLDIDGFRVDVAWGVKRRRPDFWLEWRRELKRINPDLMLIAEATAVDPYYFRNGFDIGYDWTTSPGQWPWANVFQFPEESGALLEPALTNGGKGYAPDAIVMRFLNNNDTGARFVDQHGPELTRVAATMQFTVPGVPEMFAGDEIGASYEPYSNLTPIPWRDRYGFLPFYKKLIDLKHGTPALNSKRMELLTTDTNSVLAYVRPAVGESGPVLVLLNFAGKARVTIEPSAALESAIGASGGVMRDVVSAKEVRLDVGPKSTTVFLPAESSFVLMGAS